jgi:TolB-like protein/Flp pilus assembly protein TadD
MGEQRHQHLYEFGPFRLDTRERVLLRDGRPLQLKPKVYETLLALISQSGHVVDKEDLMRQVWPDVVVEENNLTGNIYALRRMFAEYDCIETVPRRGYRFTAEVKRVQVADVKVVNRSASETEVQIKETISTSGHAIDSLAVLPFINAGADPEAEYLSDGITESIITNLSQLSQLRVMARSTVFRYKGRESDPREVGIELGVRAVLLGRVVQLNDRLSIRAELVDVADGAQLWGECYQIQMADILDVQEEIAREIFEKLRVRLTNEERKRLGKRHTESPEAYQAYLRGRYYWNKRTEEGLKKSTQYFQQAVDIDPAYAPAYAGLADSYALPGIAEYGLLPPREAMPRAKAAASRALEIDDTLAEAQTTLAHVRAFYDWDWPRAEQEFKQAIKLDPNYAFAHHWYALFLAAMGRHAEAIAEEERAQEIDPLSLIISKNVGTILYYAGRLDESIEHYRKTLELEPNFARTHIYLGLAYERRGTFKEAIAEYQEALRISGGGTVLSALLGHAHALSGNRAEAVKIIDRLMDQSERQYVPAFNIALIHAALGENDLAFEWLDKAAEERSSWLVSLNVEPMLDSLRSDPRFTALLKRLGLAA